MLCISCYYDYCCYCFVWRSFSIAFDPGYWRAAMFRSFLKKSPRVSRLPRIWSLTWESLHISPRANEQHEVITSGSPTGPNSRNLATLLASSPVWRGLLSEWWKCLCTRNSNSEACSCLLPRPSSDQPLLGIHYGWPQPLLSSPNWWLGGSREGHSAFSTLITMISKKLRA